MRRSFQDGEKIAHLASGEVFVVKYLGEIDFMSKDPIITFGVDPYKSYYRLERNGKNRMLPKSFVESGRFSKAW